VGAWRRYRRVVELHPYAAESGAGERLVFGEIAIVVRVPSESTGGAFAIIEEAGPMVDTPAHLHEHEDELFYVLEGEHVYEVGDEQFRLGPGGLVFAPRGVPHSQRRVVSGVGRQLVLVSPGGLEGFFRDLAAAHEEGTLGAEAYAAASERYGITWIS
jgi:mannose-6-phosphate isomerase-like protein (cupin superfamily)